MSTVRVTEAQVLAAQLLKRLDELAGRTPSPKTLRLAAAGEVAGVILRPNGNTTNGKGSNRTSP